MQGLIVLGFCMTALAVPMRTFLPVFADKVFHQGVGTQRTAAFHVRHGIGGGCAGGGRYGERAEERPGGTGHAGLFGWHHRRIRAFQVAAAELRHVVPVRRGDDGCVCHGHLPGAAHRLQRDAGPRDQRLQLSLSAAACPWGTLRPANSSHTTGRRLYLPRTGWLWSRWLLYFLLGNGGSPLSDLISIGYVGSDISRIYGRRCRAFAARRGARSAGSRGPGPHS